MTHDPAVTLPPQLAELVEEFAEVGPRDRLQLLLELSRELPELPERYTDAAHTMEQVPECQSPLFLAVEVEPDGDRPVHLFFSAPPEAPTTRGFASIMRTGLDGEPAADVPGARRLLHRARPGPGGQPATAAGDGGGRLTRSQPGNLKSL